MGIFSPTVPCNLRMFLSRLLKLRREFNMGFHGSSYLICRGADEVDRRSITWESHCRATSSPGQPIESRRGIWTLTLSHSRRFESSLILPVRASAREAAWRGASMKRKPRAFRIDFSSPTNTHPAAKTVPFSSPTTHLNSRSQIMRSGHKNFISVWYGLNEMTHVSPPSLYGRESVPPASVLVIMGLRIYHDNITMNSKQFNLFLPCFFIVSPLVAGFL